VTSTDSLGAYSEIGFDFQTDAPRHGSIRAYRDQGIVTFTLRAPSGGPNTFSFPNLTTVPMGLNHIAFSGVFGRAVFNALPGDSPWAFFDGAGNTFVFSPADHFMVAGSYWASGGQIAANISSDIAILPAGFSHSSLLVIDSAINRAFVTWGQALTVLRGKTRPANDAGTVLSQIGYWTDAGSTYYYNTEGSLSYSDTLAAVKAEFDRNGIGLGYVQLDSWFYPKGPNADWRDASDGIYQYDAAPTLFASGLAGIAQRLALPLVTHSRWIDPSSPYRQQFTVSGNVVIDSTYWSGVAANLRNSGVVMYEQDWLSAQAQTAFNLNDPDAFLDHMSDATAQQGIGMQYCMPLARHFLQGTKYSNLTNMRVSQDRFNPPRWTDFLYGSRLAGALGVWPFADVLMSNETGNLLLSTLSAGPVGVGDRIGSLSAANLLRSVRRDGVIVKPDVPAVPLDSSFQNSAQGADAPMVASTYTDFGDLRTWYVFAYPAGQNKTAGLRLAELGAASPVYLYDYAADAGRVVNPGDQLNLPIAGDWLYLVGAPVGPSGMAVIGDTGQFVTMGRKRVSSFGDDGIIHLTLAFAAGETARTVSVYAPAAPRLRVTDGNLISAAYDTSRQRFTVALAPGPQNSAVVEIYRRYHRAPSHKSSGTD
jgi:hypothetical protein